MRKTRMLRRFMRNGAFSPEEIATTEVPTKVSRGDKETEFRNEMGLMMYYPIHSAVILSDEFKAMILKDAETVEKNSDRLF